eukprot:UN05414
MKIPHEARVKCRRRGMKLLIPKILGTVILERNLLSGRRRTRTILQEHVTKMIRSISRIEKILHFNMYNFFLQVKILYLLTTCALKNF